MFLFFLARCCRIHASNNWYSVVRKLSHVFSIDCHTTELPLAHRTLHSIHTSYENLFDQRFLCFVCICISFYFDMDQCFLLQERKKSNKIVMIKTNYILMDKKIWLHNFLVLYILKEQITAIHMNIFIKSFFNWDDPNSHEPKEKLCWSD